MKQVFLSLIIMLLNNYASAQEGVNWFIGFNENVNFKCTPPSETSLISYPSAQIFGSSGSTCMSDTNGALLFFANGRTVYNKNGKAMPHGLNIMANVDSSYNLINHVLTIPNPGNQNQYYIFFTTIGDTIISGKQYSALPYLSYVIVDMSLDGGNGDISGILHHIENNVGTGLTAAHHRNKHDFWLVLYKQGIGAVSVDTIIAFQISSSGLKRSVTQVNDSSNAAFIPILSYDAKRLAIYINGSTGYYPIKLFDFDNRTGMASDEIEIFSTPTTNNGISFSPDNTKLYLNAENTSTPYFNYIYQYDISEKGNVASKMVVYKAPPNSGFGLKQADDGKIYNVEFNNKVMWSIDNPNENGNLCHINPNAVKITVAPLGLDPPLYITRKPEFMPYTISNFCSNMPVVFTPFQNLNSPVYQWDFGDPLSGNLNKSSQKIGSHLYKTPGTYKVHFISWNYDSIIDTFTRFVCISPGLMHAEMDSVLCSGEMVTLDAENSGAKYLWNTGDTTQTKKVGLGTYWVAISNGSCVITDTAHIISINSVKINLGKDTAIANGSRLILHSGYPSARWSTGEVGDSIIVTKAGKYWATLHGSKCEVSDTIIVKIKGAIDEKDHENTFDIKLYPNPANQKLYYSFKYPNQLTCRIRIYNMSGILMIEKTNNSYPGINNNSIDISILSPGIYTLKFSTNIGLVSKQFEVE